MVSASGGFEVPSTLSVLAFAVRRLVIASRLGMFLYPTGYLFFFAGSPAFTVPPSSVFFSSASSSFSLSSSSRFSVVSNSPFSLAGGVADELWGGDIESAVGEVEREFGACTAVESARDVAAEVIDACEPVRSSVAARRGRIEEEDEGALVFKLMRAASWFSTLR